MLALLAMVGLALDMSHAYVNKTRLQNSLDAAALAAAKVLDQTGDTAQAETAALTILAQNASSTGNEELGNALGDMSVVVQFSDTLNPFVPGGVSPNYVRVRANNFDLESWFIQVLGITQKTVGASAVAGPSTNLVYDEPVCGLAPMMVCGDPSDTPTSESAWGYEVGEISVLKTSSGSGGTWEVGPGNFQLIRLDGGQGGADVRDAMAGDWDACLSADGDIETEPGNTIGPVAQGLNTRFGDYNGPVNSTDHPPDVIVTENTVAITETSTADSLNYNYNGFESDKAAGNYDYQPRPDGIGVFDRRILRVPIGDCDGTTNGQGTVSSLGFGCFFLLQKVKQKGNEAEVYSQFIQDCGAEGIPGSAPNNGPGVYKIVLHKDPDSNDS